MDEAQAKRAADAATENERALNTEVVEKRNMVRRVDVPTVAGAYRRRGAACIALVHRDDAKVSRKLLARVPRRSLPKLDARAHSSRREQQDRETFAVFLIVERGAIPFKGRHGCDAAIRSEEHEGGKREGS